MGAPVTRRELMVLGGLLGAGTLTIVTARRFAPVGPDVGASQAVKAILADPHAPVGGNPQGDVTLAVWTDFNCAACRKSDPLMRAAALADRDTRIVYRDWPIFGRNSRDAARIAIASDAQGLYERVHMRLMTGPPASAITAEAAVAAEGGDIGLLRQHLATDAALIDAMLARHALEAFALRLGGTPGHLVGTLLVKGARSQREFTRAIRQARRNQARFQAGAAAVNR